MLNKVCLMGRFVRDPEKRYTSTNKPVTSFTLAVDRDGKDNGVDFIDCVAWNATADFVDKYFLKGNMAVVFGTLQIREWTDKNGNKRRSAEIVVRDIYFGDSKKKDVQAGDVPQSDYEVMDEDDVALPF